MVAFPVTGSRSATHPQVSNGDGVAARVVGGELHHLGGTCEGCIGCRSVACLPVIDLVVGLPLLLIADDRSTWRQRLLRRGDRLQGFVVDHDQGRGVFGDVLRLSDHAGNFLTLEADLVGRQHGLRIARQGGHPRELVLREQLTGDDRDHTGDRHRCAAVDALDASVCQRAAHDDHMEHARQHHVVDVVPLAVDEARILFAGTETPMPPIA